MRPLHAGEQPLWWQRGVIYQIYPRSFKDRSGDGVGDLGGVLEKLNYLSETLGIDAIWLSPFYPSPMADFGYDVSDYVNVHPMFGTLADFDAVLIESHRRDIKVIVDFVPNHTSDQHPWFIESRSSRDNPKRDWYLWADPKPGGLPPNNWLSNFGGGAWEWDAGTGQYYLHSFAKEQPDLNWRNPEVKAAMLDILRFWLDRGVDGFRIDVAHLIMKDPEMRDNPPSPAVNSSTVVAHSYDAQDHIHDKGHPDVHQIFREMRDLLDEYSREQPRMALGEIHEYRWPHWASYYGENLDELHMPFNFALLPARWNAPAVRRVVESVEGAVPAGGWPNYVLGNHDTHRLASRVGQAQSRVALMLLLTLRGTPTLYNGEEIGMHDADIPPEYIQDPWEKNEPGLGLGRDPERTPMQWDPGPNAGFCPPDVRPWLPIPDDYVEINVATELEDSRSVLALTRGLLALRREAFALNSGSYRSIEVENDGCYVYLREGGRTGFLIALNLSHEPQTLILPLRSPGTIRISTHMDREDKVCEADLPLRPDEGCVIELSEGDLDRAGE